MWSMISALLLLIGHLALVGDAWLVGRRGVLKCDLSDRAGECWAAAALQDYPYRKNMEWGVKGHRENMMLSCSSF